MANLKDTIVLGNLTVTGKINGNIESSGGTGGVYGSGTSGCLTKWTDSDTIGDGPQIGTDTTKFLNNKGEWSIPYGIANATTPGLVKSQTTGTTANRDYKVQVDTDGTMKVNVPWEADSGKVTQEHVANSSLYPLLFKSSSGINTDTVTESTKFNKQIYVQPFAGSLYAQVLNASDYLHSSGYVSVNSDRDEYRSIFPDDFSTDTDIDTRYYSRGIVLTDCDTDDEYRLSFPARSGTLGFEVFHHRVKLSGAISGYYSFIIVLDIYNTTSTKFTLETLSTHLYNRYGNDFIPCSCRIYNTQSGNTYYEQFYGFYVGSGNYHYITWRVSTSTNAVTNNSNTTTLIRLDKYTGTGIPSNVISIQSETVYAL